MYYFPSNLPVKLGDVSGDPCFSRTMVLRGDIRKLPYLYTIIVFQTKVMAYGW